MAAPLTIRLHPADNVLVAAQPLAAGTRVDGEDVAIVCPTIFEFLGR